MGLNSTPSAISRNSGHPSASNEFGGGGMTSRHGGQNDAIECTSISDSKRGRRYPSQTLVRAQNLIEKTRATPHADEPKTLLDKAAEILAKEEDDPDRPRRRRPRPHRQQGAQTRSRAPPQGARRHPCHRRCMVPCSTYAGPDTRIRDWIPTPPNRRSPTRSGVSRVAQPRRLRPARSRPSRTDWRSRAGPSPPG